MNNLIRVIEKQREFQRLVGFPIDSVREVDRNEMSEKYIFKGIEELIELRKEFPSIANPWSKHQKIADLSRITEEFSDVLLFLINFMIVWKLSPDKMLEKIEEVQNQNFNSIKVKKMDNLNREILSVPSYTSGVGQGNLNAKYVFIGQNPGQGINHGYRFWSNPEDGSSKVLLPILEKLKVLNDCYFTNVIKSTTAGNSTPTDENRDFWIHPYLMNELDIIKINNPNMKFIAMGIWTQKALEKCEPSKISHPASVLYGNLTSEQYEEEIKKAIDYPIY